MDRRTFLGLVGLGWLASASLPVIASVISQTQRQIATNSSDGIQFYVSTNGNDSWSGQQETPNATKTDGPFATLERARNAIRELKRQQGNALEEPVTVMVREGTYFLSETLVFTPEDSGTEDFPVTYKAYRNERAVISGGRRITNWKRQGNIWTTNLPDVKAGKWYFRILRAGNNWAIRARYPNFNPSQPRTEGWLFAQPQDASNVNRAQFGRNNINIDPARFPNWQNWKGAEINTFIAKNFGNSIFKIDSVDKNNSRLLGNFRNPNYPNYFIGQGNRFFIENVREALDSPGEWHLDKETGELAYWPTASNPNNIEVVAPAMDRSIVLQGNPQNNDFVEYINFQSLTFKDTDYTLSDNLFFPADAAIWLSTARYCAIEDCTFEGLGGHGVRLEKRSNENRIIKNEIADSGQGGIICREAKSTAEQAFNNLIAANEIHDCGRIYKHVAGVYVISGSENLIAHNRISRMPRYGIYINSDVNNDSDNNIVEFNEIVDTSLETADTCAMGSYTGRAKRPTGNIFRYNLIRNVVGMGTTEKGQFVSPYFSFGIYLDSFSSGVTVYGNIVINTELASVYIHGGRDNNVENNIFINGKQNLIYLRANPGDRQFMANNVIERNIVISQNPNAAFVSSPPPLWRPDGLSESNYNLFWNARSRSTLATTKQRLTPEGNFAQWQAAGFDRDSVIADPMLVGLERGNFRLNPDSPAFELGFESIPVEKIGPKGFTS
ncbi:MAG: right-handed parallel beta-helix repeat-containing protein [Hydrococcus sp. Prado102]|nr:right-handed parallel beta-helix repeat-containing protein [Hydrococcus sp. Prado102]